MVLRNEIVLILSVVDFSHLITAFTDSNDKIPQKVQETHKNKLYNLDSLNVIRNPMIYIK